MVGGLVVGLVEIFVKVYIAPGWYEAITYGLLIVVLLVKPTGILGKNVGEKAIGSAEQKARNLILDAESKSENMNLYRERQ